MFLELIYCNWFVLSVINQSVSFGVPSRAGRYLPSDAEDFIEFYAHSRLNPKVNEY